MKKASLKICVLLAALLLLSAALISCGKESITGKWLITEKDEELGVELSMIMNFKEDGSLILESTQDAQIPYSVPLGTYETSGDELKITYEGVTETSAYKISGNKLEITKDGKTQVLTKVD